MNLRTALIPLALWAATNMADAKNRKVYEIDKDLTYQVIDNFSASDAWRCDFIGKYWPEEKKERIADLLFKREFDEKGNPVGMALTNWRVNIGAGSYENRETKGVDNSWNRTECFLSANGTWDFTKQAGQRWFMEAARRRGMNNFLFFTNSAPYFMTRSGATVAPLRVIKYGAEFVKNRKLFIPLRLAASMNHRCPACFVKSHVPFAERKHSVLFQLLSTPCVSRFS